MNIITIYDLKKFNILTYWLFLTLENIKMYSVTIIISKYRRLTLPLRHSQTYFVLPIGMTHKYICP